MRRSGVRSSSSPPAPCPKASREIRDCPESLENQRSRLFSCPRQSRSIPTHRGSHCRNLCRNQKICSIDAAEFLHGPPPHFVQRHDQGGQARRCQKTTHRRRWPVPAPVRKGRVASLALRLQLERKAQHAEPWHLPEHRPESGSKEGR